MTPTSNESRRAAALDAWAREQLGVHEQASPDEIRRHALEALAEMEFVPYDDWRSAYEALNGEQAKTPAGFLQAEEAAILRESDELASAWLRTSDQERRQRWQQLMQRSEGFRRATVRLRAMQPSLAYDTEQIKQMPPMIRELAEHAVTLSVLRPATRGARRAAIVAKYVPEISKWEVAARTVKKDHPDLAKLAPDLINQLAKWSRKRKRAPARPPAETERQPIVTTRHERQSSESSVPWWVIAIGVLIVGNAFRACATMDSPRTPPKYQFEDFNYEAPKPDSFFTPEEYGDWKKDYEQKQRELDELKRALRENRERRGLPPSDDKLDRRLEDIRHESRRKISSERLRELGIEEDTYRRYLESKEP